MGVSGRVGVGDGVVVSVGVLVDGRDGIAVKVGGWVGVNAG